jgi:predicted permease
MSSYEGISSVVAIDAIASTTNENASFGVYSSPQTTRVESHKNEEEISSDSHPPPLALTNLSRKFLLRRRLIAIVRSLLIPASLTIILSFIIALITPLKALFVPVVNSPIPNGPDGLPPLSFLLDTATFIGGASVPLGLICVGSALARLKIPRSQWNSLPLGAISGLAIGKMIVTPILGVLICEGLTKAGLIDVNDKVLRFVCM